MPRAPSNFLAGRKTYAARERDRKRAFNLDRPKSYSQLYDHRWTQYRRIYLAEHPYCLECRAEGVITPATVIHHIRDHRGDPTLFWAPDNHTPICKPHHDAHTARTVLNAAHL